MSHQNWTHSESLLNANKVVRCYAVTWYNKGFKKINSVEGKPDIFGCQRLFWLSSFQIITSAKLSY